MPGWAACPCPKGRPCAPVQRHMAGPPQANRGHDVADMQVTLLRSTCCRASTVGPRFPASGSGQSTATIKTTQFCLQSHTHCILHDILLAYCLHADIAVSLCMHVRVCGTWRRGKRSARDDRRAKPHAAHCAAQGAARAVAAPTPRATVWAGPLRPQGGPEVRAHLTCINPAADPHVVAAQLANG